MGIAQGKYILHTNDNRREISEVWQQQQQQQKRQLNVSFEQSQQRHQSPPLLFPSPSDYKALIKRKPNQTKQKTQCIQHHRKIRYTTNYIPHLSFTLK